MKKEERIKNIIFELTKNKKYLTEKSLKEIEKIINYPGEYVLLLKTGFSHQPFNISPNELEKAGKCLKEINNQGYTITQICDLCNLKYNHYKRIIKGDKITVSRDDYQNILELYHQALENGRK